MANIGPRIRSPEEVQPAPSVRKFSVDAEEDRGRLLELRTESGAVYIRPSWWPRIRLLWTFRHFHVLPSLVLSRRDQRLIERLSRSALVTPALPVASSTVFGVVEKVRSKPPVSVRRVVNGGIERTGIEPERAQAFLAKPRIPDLRIERRNTTDAHREREAWGLRGTPLLQWGALGILVVVCITAMLVWVYGASFFRNTAQARNSRTPAVPIEQPANGVAPRELHAHTTGPIRVLPPVTPSPGVERSKRVITPPLAPGLASPASLQLSRGVEQPVAAGILKAGSSTATLLEPATLTPKSSAASSPYSLSQLNASGPGVGAGSTGVASIQPAAITPSSSERVFVSELPQGHFAYPVVAHPNMVGELHLRALIGVDGSVKEVTVLSGSPELAEAGMRAVRQWHYSPYQSLGHPVEVETQIKMNFFGRDAVSITSVPHRTASELK